MTKSLECKKHGLRQTQNGQWVLTVIIHPDDAPADLLTDPMGTRYGMALVKMEEVEEQKPPLSTRAVMMCKDEQFQEFCQEISMVKGCDKFGEDETKNIICNYCLISSRSKLNTDHEAADKFLSLCNRFDQWKLEKRYSDNLSQ